MASERFIDFDRAIEEAAEEPVVVRYQGRDWPLYASLPAKPVLRLLRLQAEAGDGASLTEGQIVEFMAQLVPGDVLDAWLEGGMTLDHMAQLLQLVMAAYRFGGGDSEGEAQGPETGPTPSSSAGQQ